MAESYIKRSVSRVAQNIIQTQRRQWFVDYLPITGGNEVKLYIDGEDYGKDLMDALLAAKRQVFLTGLHFHPQWELVRGGGKQGNTTLLAVLRHVAQRGVEIFLIVNQFWTDEYTAGDVTTGGEISPTNLIRKKIISSAHLDWYLPQTLELFEGLAEFPNVHCRTDVHKGFVMSTHHQKTVVIDEKMCFLGGIDLTKVDGDRWDTHQHSIPALEHEDIRNYTLPEHLWHDVHCQVKGPAVQFVVDNFHARWNPWESLQRS